MICYDREEEAAWKKTIFPNNCFPWSLGGQRWGQALFGCGNLRLPGAIFINPAGWAAGLWSSAHPSPCCSSGQKSSLPFPFSLLFRAHLPDRGIKPWKGQPQRAGASFQPGHNIYGVEDGRRKHWQMSQEVSSKRDKEMTQGQRLEGTKFLAASSEIPLVIYALPFTKLQMNLEGQTLFLLNLLDLQGHIMLL